MKTTTFADTCATRNDFIEKKFVEIICQVLEIKLQRLNKSKQIQEFDNIAAKPITHFIYPILTINTHTKSSTSLLLIKLGNYPMIFG